LIAFTFLEAGAVLMLGAGFYCVCGMWRLAHYNVTAAEQQSHYAGLPVPGAMLFVTMTIWCAANFELPAPLCVPVFIAAGLLMVSSLKLKKYGLWQVTLGVIGLAFLSYVVYLQFC
jgi:CDP-diacylglycerol--serine O-phosphatidyltransferase